jgi:hypothetical protein
MIHIFPESLAIVDLRCFLGNDYIKIFTITAVKRGNLPTRPSERYQPSFSNSCPIKSPLSSAGGNLSMKTLVIFLCLTTTAWAQPWPQTAPRIGNLYLKLEYWNYMKEAAQRYQISPYLIQAVCAIESRFDPDATSGRGRCFGLMQLDQGTAKVYGVDAHNPKENIMGGAAVIARLMQKYHGDIKKVLHVYNAACTPSYVREVIRAYKQARLIETSSLSSDRPDN